MSKDAEMFHGSDEILEIAKELFILPADEQQEAQEEFFIPPTEDQALPDFRLEDYVDFLPTPTSNPPRNVNTIFCHCSFRGFLGQQWNVESLSPTASNMAT